MTLLALGAWFLAACIAGLLGVVSQPDAPLFVLAFVTVPLLVFVTAYSVSASFRAFADGIDLRLLVGSHVWRFVGLGFIVGALTGHLPMGFGIPEGVGDVVAALGAVLLLPGLRTSPPPRGWLLAWNTFGLVDLVSAITVGMLFSEGKLGVLRGAGVSTELMVIFPVSLIPTFFVPLFILLHLLTFKRIASMGRAGSGSEREQGPLPEAHARA